MRGLTNSSSLKMREKMRMKSTADDLVIVYLEQRHPQIHGCRHPHPKGQAGPKEQRQEASGICAHMQAFKRSLLGA